MIPQFSLVKMPGPPFEDVSLILSVYVALLVVGPDGPGATVISRQSPEGADFRGCGTVTGVEL